MALTQEQLDKIRLLSESKQNSVSPTASSMTPDQINQIRSLALSKKQPVRQSQPTRLQETAGDVVETTKGISEAGSRRLSSIQENFQKAVAGDLNPARFGVRTVGDIIGGLGEIAAEGVIGAGKLLLPESAEKKIETSFSEGIQNTNILGTGLSIPDVVHKWEAFSQEHPEISKDLAGVGNILSGAPVTKGAQVGTRVARESIETAAEKSVLRTAKKAIKRSDNAAKKAEKTYAKILGGTKKQVKDIDEFSKVTGESLEGYLAKIGAEIQTTDGGKKFSTNVAMSDMDIGMEPLFSMKENVLKQYRGSKTVSLDDVADAARNSVKKQPRLASDTRNIQLKEIDNLIEAERKSFGDFLDPYKADQVKSGLQSIAFNTMTPQKAPAGKAVARAMREAIENAVGEDIIKTINKEIQKAILAKDFLKNINGNAVKGGRLGAGFTRLIGTVAGTTTGPVGALLVGEGAVRLVSMLNDVNRLSVGAINKLRKAGVIPSSIKTIEDSRKFLKDLIRKRESTKLLGPGAIKAPSHVDKAGLLTQKESSKRLSELGLAEKVVDVGKLNVKDQQRALDELLGITQPSKKGLRKLKNIKKLNLD